MRLNGMLPHWFINTPLERKITGHQGVTYLLWTFVDLAKDVVMRPEHARFRRHEDRHVLQSVVVTLVWLAFTFGLTRLFDWSWLWVLTAVLAWPFTYWAVSLVWKLRTGKGYTDNWFERDAERYAGRAS